MNFDAMTKLIGAFVLTAVAFLIYTPVAIPADELPQIATARASVRLWQSEMGYCSVVVYAPGKAFTAAHCLVPLKDGTVDGKPVTKTEQYGTTDLARIEVPGLDCPCAPLATRPIETGDPAFIVGFPHGALRVLNWGVAQEMPIHPEAKGYRAVTVPCAPGCSGGGMFNRYGKLLGVTSMLIPNALVILYTPLPGL